MHEEKLFNVCQDGWWIKGKCAADWGLACQEVSSFIAYDTCMAWAEDPLEHFNATFSDQLHPVCIQHFFLNLLQSTHGVSGDDGSGQVIFCHPAECFCDSFDLHYHTGRDYCCGT